MSIPVMSCLTAETSDKLRGACWLVRGNPGTNLLPGIITPAEEFIFILLGLGSSSTSASTSPVSMVTTAVFVTPPPRGTGEEREGIDGTGGSGW